MTLNFQELVKHHKGDRSYAAIAMRAGGTVNTKAIQSIAKDGFTRFPSTDMITGIAEALRINPRELVLAAARTLGIPVDDEDPEQLQRPGTPDTAEQLYYWRKHAEHYKARAQKGQP